MKLDKIVNCEIIIGKKKFIAKEIKKVGYTEFLWFCSDDNNIEKFPIMYVQDGVKIGVEPSSFVREMKIKIIGLLKEKGICPYNIQRKSKCNRCNNYCVYD